MIDDPDQINWGLIFGMITLIVAIAFGCLLVGNDGQSFSVSNIPDDERWHDLNNNAGRNRFCQAMGYEQGKISENAGFGSVFVRDDAGNPYGYDVYCIRTVEEYRIYDYSQYKKWLVSMEITNKT